MCCTSPGARRTKSPTCSGGCLLHRGEVGNIDRVGGDLLEIAAARVLVELVRLDAHDVQHPLVDAVLGEQPGARQPRPSLSLAAPAASGSLSSRGYRTAVATSACSPGPRPARRYILHRRPPPEPAERRVLGTVGLRAGCAGLRADALQLHRRVGRTAHHGRAGSRSHSLTRCPRVGSRPIRALRSISSPAGSRRR